MSGSNSYSEGKSLMPDQPQNRFTVHAGHGSPRWEFTYGISGTDAARRYYSEIIGVPLARVLIEAGEPTRDNALRNSQVSA